MHYHKSAWAITPGNITIRTLKASFQDDIGERAQISDGDIRQIIEFYENGFACPIYQDCKFFSKNLQLVFDCSDPGNNFHKIFTDTWQHCSMECIQHERCKGWSFVPGRRRCFLKDPLPTQKAPMDGVIVISGHRRCLCMSCFNDFFVYRKQFLLGVAIVPKLCVKVIKAENLPDMDNFIGILGRPDPYVEFFVDSLETVFKTGAKSNKRNPIWNTGL